MNANSSGALRQNEVQRGNRVTFTFDGDVLEGFAGESLAAALLGAGRRVLRFSPRTGAPRGAFCWMGICQECTVWVDGRRWPSCRVALRQGMVVRSGTIG